jgi:phosphoribosylformylglycinamidine synthase
LDYQGVKGLATSVGHAPAAGLIRSKKRFRFHPYAEALTNIIWAPIEGGLSLVFHSAPTGCGHAKIPVKMPGLYEAVKAASDFALALGINIPTGKDSLVHDSKVWCKWGVVYSPGTVIISAAGEVKNIKKVVEPVIQDVAESIILYTSIYLKIFLNLGGSSFGQTINKIGK